MYGGLAHELRDRLGVRCTGGRVPLLLHPQPTAAQRRLRDSLGAELLRDVRVTPTASYRSVVAFRGGRATAVLKLSFGARVSGRRRDLREAEIANAVAVSLLFERIRQTVRKLQLLDWFSEPAGLVETSSGCGWILRRFPAAGVEHLVPAFSLFSRRGEKVPLLVEMIRDAREVPEQFVTECVLWPYVRALAYLMLQEGLFFDGHAQNVLFEVRRNRLTGRVVLRDLSDVSVSVPLRIARGLPLPSLHNFPQFPTDTIARSGAAFDTVQKWGLRGFVAPLNTSLLRFFPGYNAPLVNRRYCELWREQCVRWLDVEPVVNRRTPHVPVEEALDHWLRHKDWNATAAADRVKLPRNALPLTSAAPSRAAVYTQLDCAWGELFVRNQQPQFFRPAF